MIGGLRPYEVTLLCAPTGSGKTQFIANLSAQLLEQKVPQFVAPVETGDTDYQKRIASALIRKDINSGLALDPGRLATIETKIGMTLSGPLTIAGYENRVSAKEMIDMLSYQHVRYGCRVALLDNLNFFLEIVNTTMERAEMDSAMHEFVMLAKKLPMHIILIVHPRKTEDGRVESEFDIKGSSTAVQECANVLLFNRPKKADIENQIRNRSDREAVFRKIRKRGQNVGTPIWFKFSEGCYYEYRSKVPNVVV